jgi:lambda family phage portal protein
MRWNLVDRLVEQVAPRHALQRAVARAKLEVMQATMPATSAAAGDASGYTSTAGGDSFLGRWFARPRSAAADTLRQIGPQRGQARDLVRNHPLAASAINTNVARAIGTGLVWVPMPHLATLGWTVEEATAWSEEVFSEFSLWADSTECDWYGDQNFYQLQDLVTRARLESGDAFSLLPDGEATSTQPYRLRVQVLEADRIGNPKGEGDSAEVSGGIRRGASGRVTGVHVYNQHPGAHVATAGAGVYAGNWVEPVGASGRRRILHHFKRLRPEQPRGVSYLAPVMGLFKLLGDYTDAEVKAAVVSAWLTMVITSDSGTGPAPVFGLGDTGGAGAGPGQQAASAEVEMGPGAVIGLAKGESAAFNNPGRPNPAFGPFVQSVLDQLGAGTFLGPELIIKKFSTSYTAARAAWLDAWKHLLDVRTQTAADFCQPVMETWLAEAVSRGRIRAPGFFTDPRMRWAYCRGAWHGDSQGSLNPRDEVTAFLDAIDGGLTTHTRGSWELFGQDFKATVAQRAADEALLTARNITLRPRAGAAAAPQPSRAPEPGAA